MNRTWTEIKTNKTKSKAVFAADGPKPQFLIDTPKFKALVVGLEAGGQIPAPFTEDTRIPTGISWAPRMETDPSPPASPLRPSTPPRSVPP